LSPGGGFSPRAIPGLIFYVDASYITGLNDGDSVTTWNDLSGNGYNATQTTAAQKPIYKKVIINNKDIVRVDPTDDSMFGTFPTLNANATVVFVGIITTHAINARLWHGRTDVNNYIVLIEGDSGGNIRLRAQTNFNSTVTSQMGNTNIAASTAFIGSLIFSSGNTIALWVNGTSQTVSAQGAIGAPATDNTYRIRTTTVLNALDVAAIAYYNTNISVNNLARLHSYFSSRFAIALS